MSLAESEDRNPYLTVALFSYHRAEGTLSDEKIAEKLRFDSVEKMHATLQSWELPDWLIGTEAKSGRRDGQRQSRLLDPRIVLRLSCRWLGSGRCWYSPG